MSTPNEDALLCAQSCAYGFPSPGAAKRTTVHIHRLVSENEAQAALLQRVALLAHFGGIYDLSESEALVYIRRTTLPAFEQIRSLSADEIYVRLKNI